jgi:hypothetical protein
MMNFEYYLADALREHSPGAVATALENKGCYGYDRFGRIVHLEGALIEPVLALVAHFYQAVTDWYKDEKNYCSETGTYFPAPDDDCFEEPDDSDFWKYGWPTDKDIPIFTDSTPIRKNALSEKPLRTRERENLYVLIIAMAIDKYAYDVNALKSPTPAKLQKMLKRRFEIDYTAATISAHLKAARELVALNI